MNPTAQSLSLDGRRVVHFIDEGQPGWRPLVFFGGLGTSIGAFYLTEFARTARERLCLRVISVERNGFGETSFDPSLGYADAVDDVLAVLASLAIDRFAIVAFSGGGAFAAALSARVPERVRSLHLAAAAAGALIATCGSASERFAHPAQIARDPGAMWEYPPDSPVHEIPGFARAAIDEGFRALGSDGRGARALAHEWRLLCSGQLPDLTAVVAPAFLYWGDNDDVVPPAHACEWRRALPSIAALRCYRGEAHDVQYVHWDQILLDVAGLGALRWTAGGVARTS
jgi:non-heme chloroperoxidase